MSLEELVRRKNGLHIDLLAAKTAKKPRRVILDLANEAASLESRIARILQEQDRPHDAAINLVSQASCLRDARRDAEARRVLEVARSICGHAGTASWIDEELARIPSEYVPASVFASARASITENEKLRHPQTAAYEAAKLHFSRSSERALIQLPVGCGKTGTMAILPFGIARGRALVVAPNTEIAGNLARELDYSNPECFLRRAGVLSNGQGPRSAILNSDAQLGDADNADYVVANIQQLVASGGEKWLNKLASDYFDLVLVDESHHAAAKSWNRVLDHFPRARVAGFTATPLRSDGKPVEGRTIYKYPLSEAIRAGYVSDIASRRLDPVEIHFTYKGETRQHTLDEIMELREENWFSRGVALSRECNEHIVDASIVAMRELRQGSTVPHQIVASACSVDHAQAIRSLYTERGLRADVLHSDMKEDKKDDVRHRLRTRALDAVVQVFMLGEGADYPTLSVAAIFRPYRHVVPYIQFVGRVMRVVRENAPGHPDNRAFIVSHVGLHVDRWWKDLKRLDAGDQEVFQEIANSARDFAVPHSPGETPHRPFRPDMQVLREEIATFVEEGFLKQDREALVDDLMAALALRGFNVADLGMSREQLMQAMVDHAGGPHIGQSVPTMVSPQKARLEAQRRLNERVRSAAKRLLAKLGLAVTGIDLVRRFPSGGAKNNLGAAVVLLNKEVYEFLGVAPGERDLLDEAESERAHDAMDDLIARVEQRVSGS